MHSMNSAAAGAQRQPRSGQSEAAAELPGQVVGAVRWAAGSCPALRRVWAVLSRDLLALLTGLRPAVMLDYITGAPEQALCSVVRDVTSLSGAAGVLWSSALSRILDSISGAILG